MVVSPAICSFKATVQGGIAGKEGMHETEVPRRAIANATRVLPWLEKVAVARFGESEAMDTDPQGYLPCQVEDGPVCLI